MNPYTKDTIPGARGYVPAPMPVPPDAKKQPRRALVAWYHTAGRGRYLVAAAFAGTGALTVPLVVHSLTSPHDEVLTAVRDLPAGHVITRGDLSAVPVDGSSVPVIPANRAVALIGQRLRVEVPSGALLVPGDLGSYPPAGTTLVPVSVKAGQYPPNLEAGDRVAVFPAAGVEGTSTQPAAHAAATGRVVQVQDQDQPDSANGTVVVLLATSTTQAPVIAQAPTAVLVTLDGEGDTP